MVTENEVQPLEWIRGVNDLEYFGSLSLESLNHLLENNETGRYYVESVLYQQECAKYRKGGLLSKESKIMFLIGPYHRGNNMWFAEDFDGNRIRTKKSDGRSSEVDVTAKNLLYKASEKVEVIGTLSRFIDDADNLESLPESFAEVADVFYNLYHLKTTDPDAADWYETWIRNLAKPLGLTDTQIMKLVSAKYHPRMFHNGGNNNFEQEDQAIHTLLEDFYGPLTETEENIIVFKYRLSYFLTLVDVLFETALPKRLSALHFEHKGGQKNPPSLLQQTREFLLGKKAYRKSKYNDSLETDVTIREKMDDDERVRLFSIIYEILNLSDVHNNTYKKQ